MGKKKSLRKKLLEDLELIEEQAYRSIVCPPDFGTKQKVYKSARELEDYIKNSEYKKRVREK